MQRCRAFYNEVTDRSKLVIAKNKQRWKRCGWVMKVKAPPGWRDFKGHNL
jgi:hypothetical protein